MEPQYDERDPIDGYADDADELGADEEDDEEEGSGFRAPLMAYFLFTLTTISSLFSLFLKISISLRPVLTLSISDFVSWIHLLPVTISDLRIWRSKTTGPF